VFTTFTTPYMIRLAVPAYNVVSRMLPDKWKARLERITDETDEQAPDELQQLWNDSFKRFVFTMLINSVLCIAIMTLMVYYGQPLIANMVPAEWVRPVTSLIGLVLCAPFLWMLLKSGGDSPEVNKLWESGSHWRVRLTAYGLLRIVVTAVFVSYFVYYAMPWSTWLGMFAIVAIMFLIYYSSTLEKHSNRMTRNFTDNLSAREKMNQ